MQALLADKFVEEFEHGRLTRRQLVTRLMGLGAAMAALDSNAGAANGGRRAGDRSATAAPAAEPTFRATGLDHIALDVADVPRSRDFYAKHLGLRLSAAMIGPCLWAPTATSS